MQKRDKRTFFEINPTNRLNQNMLSELKSDLL